MRNRIGLALVVLALFGCSNVHEAPRLGCDPEVYAVPYIVVHDDGTAHIYEALHTR